MKRKRAIHFSLIAIILLTFALIGCKTSTEPNTTLSQFQYYPSKPEAKQQTEEIINETLKQTVSTLLGYHTINSNNALSKIGSDDYYYVNGWHVWRGHITKSPFQIKDAYSAEYLAKVQFKNSSKNIVKTPNNNTKYIYWFFKAHGALGFVNGKPYGDEVWYDVEGNATPLKANPTLISMKGIYNRRWVGIKDGKDAEYLYKANFDFHNLKFFYSNAKNDYKLKGKIKVDLEPFILKITFNNSRVGKTEVYKDGKLKYSYKHEYPNFYAIYNIPSLTDWELGKNFEFPGPIPL